MVREEAELARRTVAMAKAGDAKRELIKALSSDEGLKLQKHGRNGKTTVRSLYSTEHNFMTLTWGRAVFNLKDLQEVRVPRGM